MDFCISPQLTCQIHGRRAAGVGLPIFALIIVHQLSACYCQAPDQIKNDIHLKLGTHAPYEHNYLKWGIGFQEKMSLCADSLKKLKRHVDSRITPRFFWVTLCIKTNYNVIIPFFSHTQLGGFWSLMVSLLK